MDISWDCIPEYRAPRTPFSIKAADILSHSQNPHLVSCELSLRTLMRASAMYTASDRAGSPTSWFTWACTWIGLRILGRRNWLLSPT